MHTNDLYYFTHFHFHIHHSSFANMTLLNEYALALVTISVSIVVILWYRTRLLSSSKGSPPLPPGPRSLPIVGYLPFVSPDLHKQFTDMAHTYGPIFKLHLGSKLHVVINTPELAKEVVRDQDDTFANRNPPIAASIVTYGGQGIVWSNNNSYWRNLRKTFVHEVLSNKNLEACGSFREDAVRKTIRSVFGKIGTETDVSEISFSTEANVVTSMVWENTSVEGVKGNNLAVELQTVVTKIVELVGQPNVSDIFPSLAWLDLQGVKKKTYKQLAQLDRIFESIIDDRIKSNSKLSQDGNVVEGKKDFLQILLELKEQNVAASLNIPQIKALLMDIMVGGTETTTTLIEWAMTELLRNPTVMQKVQEELTEIVGLNNNVKESHLPKLEYLDATIKETFRLHPVVPFLVPRSPSKEVTVGGYTIPKGTTVFLNAWSIHRDPRYWDKPLEFNPERFLTSEETKKWDFKGNNLKFFPFGSGRRLCPGIPLAEKMQTFMLASFLHSFDWSLPKGEVHDVSERFGITLKKKKPLIAIPSQRLSNESLYN